MKAGHLQEPSSAQPVGRQIPQPIRQIEKTRLIRDDIDSNREEKSESAIHRKGERFLEVSSFLMAGQLGDTVWFDDATIIVGASGVPAWLSRPGVYRLSGPPRSIVAAERLARAEAIHAELDRAQAFAQLRAVRVGFYLTLAAAPPAWDLKAQHADLRAGQILGWRVPR